MFDDSPFFVFLSAGVGYGSKSQTFDFISTYEAYYNHPLRVCMPSVGHSKHGSYLVSVPVGAAVVGVRVGSRVLGDRYGSEVAGCAEASSVGPLVGLLEGEPVG